MKVKVDNRTKKWCKEHPDSQTTMRKCEKCGLYYKPSLGHKCKEMENEQKENNKSRT